MLKPGSACTVVRPNTCLEKLRTITEVSVYFTADTRSEAPPPPPQFGRPVRELAMIWKVKKIQFINLSFILQLNAHEKFNICILLLSNYLFPFSNNGPPSQKYLFSKSTGYCNVVTMVVLQNLKRILCGFIMKLWLYLLNAIRLTPGGSSTSHIYTQTVHRTTQWNRISRKRTQK
jgi:hypothetical protein